MQPVHPVQHRVPGAIRPDAREYDFWDEGGERCNGLLRGGGTGAVGQRPVNFLGSIFQPRCLMWRGNRKYEHII